MLPFPAEIPGDKADAPHHPVDDHGHPHAEHAHTHIFSQYVTENNAEDPHGHNGDDHAHLSIPGGPEGGRYGKCQRPDQHAAHGVENDNVRCHLRRLAGQIIGLQDQGQHQHDDHVGDHHAGVGDAQKLFCVIFHLSVVAGSHTPCDHRGHRQGDGHAGQYLEGGDDIGHRVGCDGVGTEGGDEAQHDDLPKLEHAVLQAIWHSDAQYLAYHSPIGPVSAGGPHIDSAPAVRQQDHDEDGRRHPGHQCGDGHTLCPSVKSVDQDGISRHIDDIHDNRYPHGDLRVSHSPENGRPSVVESDKGDGGGHDHQVGVRMPHDVRLDLAENAVQDPVFAGVDDEGDHHRTDGDKPHKLLCRLAGLLLPLLSQILARHHGAAGPQCGKHIDEQHHDIVHQGHPGHGRLPHAGHHDAVRHSHKDSQHLFDDKRDDEGHQRPVVK